MCVVLELGLTKYQEAYKLQKTLQRQRVEGKISDVLLLLEHPPTLTIGKSGTLDNVLVSRDKLAQQGISLFFIDRGGDVTYHGPGQLVGYPIVDLRRKEKDLHCYINNLEEVILRTLKDFSINGNRDESHPGVWVNGEEIATIGLSVRRWVSMHGFALNINTDLEHFSFINPCGFSDKRATSMSKILGSDVPIGEVTKSLISHFCDVFDFAEISSVVSQKKPYTFCHSGLDPESSVFDLDSRFRGNDDSHHHCKEVLETLHSLQRFRYILDKTQYSY